MADFGLIGGNARGVASGLDTSALNATALTANAAANTPGAYVELLSAANNTFSSSSLIVTLSDRGVAYNQSSFLVSLAIGGVGSEVVIVPNLHMFIGASSQTPSIALYRFPISIPAGQRISARCQSDVGSRVIDVHITRTTSSFSPGSPLNKVTTIGANTATTSGVTVARAAIGVFGSWVPITASSTVSIKGFVVSGFRNATSWSNDTRISYQVAVGGAGLEQIIYEGELIGASSTEVGSNCVSSFVGVSIPAGRRISIRAVGNIAGTDLDLDYLIYGVS